LEIETEETMVSLSLSLSLSVSLSLCLSLCVSSVSDANSNPEGFVCDLSVFSEFEHSWALIGLPGGLSSALSLSLRCGHQSSQLLVCSPELLSVVMCSVPSP
jgi:hypothetical protein